MRLFRVARTLILVEEVENDGHEAKIPGAKGPCPSHMPLI
jgi:hypothetical protein